VDAGHVCVCESVCVCKRERETDRERQTNRQKERVIECVCVYVCVCVCVCVRVRVCKLLAHRRVSGPACTCSRCGGSATPHRTACPPPLRTDLHPIRPPVSHFSILYYTFCIYHSISLLLYLLSQQRHEQHRQSEIGRGAGIQFESQICSLCCSPRISSGQVLMINARAQ